MSDYPVLANSSCGPNASLDGRAIADGVPPITAPPLGNGIIPIEGM
jgi:hypothetical protein